MASDHDLPVAAHGIGQLGVVGGIRVPKKDIEEDGARSVSFKPVQQVRVTGAVPWGCAGAGSVIHGNDFDVGGGCGGFEPEGNVVAEVDEGIAGEEESGSEEGG